MSTYIDPLEQRDRWRNVWQALCSDALLAALIALSLVGTIASFVFPQAPNNGVLDLAAINRWQAQSRLQLGGLFDVLSSLGLNDVSNAGWFRVVLILLVGVAVLRLLDKLIRLFVSRNHGTEMRDETRMRVTDAAPDFDTMRAWLNARRYRVSQTDDTLNATRAPLAELFSVALHAGLIVAAIGLLINALIGWSNTAHAIAPQTISSLSSDTDIELISDDANPIVVRLLPSKRESLLALNQNTNVGGVDISLKQITKGFRVSAASAKGEPLRLTTSNFLEPTTEVLVTFSPDASLRFIAIPQAQLALSLNAEAEAARFQAYQIGSGLFIREGAIQSSVTINDTQLHFAPIVGVVIDARYQPGNLLLSVGVPLALLGLAGALALPMRRIVVKHHGHWTEFYTSGRGVREDVKALLEADQVRG
jgi:hypothetical protein